MRGGGQGQEFEPATEEGGVDFLLLLLGGGGGGGRACWGVCVSINEGERDRGGLACLP